MGELRKIRKIVEGYENLIKYDVERARRNCLIYIEDIETIKDSLRNYRAKTYEMFQEFETTSKNVSEVEIGDDIGLLKSLMLYAMLFFVNRRLNKICLEMSETLELTTRLDKVYERFVQFKFL